MNIKTGIAATMMVFSPNMATKKEMTVKMVTHFL